MTRCSARLTVTRIFKVSLSVVKALKQLLVVFCGGGRLEETLEAAEDTAIDIPHIWLYLAELITPMLHEDGISMGQLFR